MSRPLARRPLAGRRVVVTRPAGGADPVARRLRALGASVLAAPAIAFEAAGPAAAAALDARLAGLDDGDWVAFASATAVRAVAGRPALARAAAAGARIAAVGAATAAACRAAGLDVAVTAADGTARGLAAAMVGAGSVAPGPARGSASRTARPPRAILPGADIARAELADGLRAAGWAVEPVVVYRTVPRPPAPAVVHALAVGVDAVVFASPSAARALFGGLDAAARAGLARAAVVCIGPTTAAAVAAAGLRVAAVAAERSAAALADAVVTAVRTQVEGACP